MGQMTVSFHERQSIDRDNVILPADVMERIERHTLDVARWRDRLAASGRHLKRGLLLYGPPGTGKTLTVTYLAGRMPEATVLLLSGPALSLIAASCSMARSLQPAVVVLEDVDLVAEERTMPGMGRNPLLFQLLNEMDGMAPDSDITFLLTTNRPDLLEPALAARPGRIDEAIEIALPDADCRRRLFELYAKGLAVDIDNWDSTVTKTEGVSGAFIKELLRKTAIEAAARDQLSPIRISSDDVTKALDDLLSESGTLSRILLGGATGRPPPTTRESLTWLPGTTVEQRPEGGYR